MRTAYWNALLPILMAASGLAVSPGDLRVSQNRRFLEYTDGRPFFYLGDTAWELFHRLNREEADKYLANRAEKGFTVIQAVVLAELDGLNVPNPYGEKPLRDNNPTQPNEAYFRHVDYIVNSARDKGLFIGMLPTWGDKVYGSRANRNVVFDAENARVYGRFLGKRYREQWNIIWVLGGDRPAEGFEPVWRAMAEGIKEGDGGRHLMTYHPGGRQSSSLWLHAEPWLDFHMIQSGHNLKDNPNYEMVYADYRLKPVKPTMDGEPRYENHPVDWNPERKGWFDDFDVRQAAYWGVFAGGHGHTYGCHDIWQMVTPQRQPIGLARGAWYSSLDLPGAGQMQYLRRLVESRPMLTRVPDQGVIASRVGFGYDHIAATRGDGYIFLYTPAGDTLRVRLGTISGTRVKAWWYDPRSGETASAGEFENSGVREFDPPGGWGRGNDWVLVIDDASKNYPPPGRPAL